MIPIYQNSISNSLEFLLLSLLFLFIGLLRAYYWKYTKLLISAAFKYRYASQYLKQDNAFTQRVNWLTFIILLINMSLLFLHQAESLGLSSFFLVFGCILFYYIIKFLIINFLGKLFFIKEISRVTVFFSYLSDKSLALVISPLVLILYFFSFDIAMALLSMVFLVGAAFLVFKLFWIWRIGTKFFGLSSIYIFLYLCILEIYPFVLITKGFFY
jgi:hypothetical protein